MESISEEYKEILIKNCHSKSIQSFNDAMLGIENNRISMALNRIYYSIFYSVMALAYKDNFISSKHKQLMGWFNKKYIYDEKVFAPGLIDIYKTAYKDRQESDYELVDIKNINIDDIQTALANAKYFIDTIFSYIEKEIKLI
jgi:uncharacterized protein (UPF0332 family)